MNPRKRHVLIVADYNADMEHLEKVFQENDLGIRRAFSGMEVMESVADEQVNLVIIQDFLSGTSGLEICRQIRRCDRYSTIPVYILTDDASKHSRRDITAAGADGFIIQPFDEGEVWSNIETKLKMLDTESRLKGALANIDRLRGFGEELLEYFDPFSFEYLASMDLLVKQVIAGSGLTQGRAERVVIALPDAKSIWHWHIYESAFGKLQRNELNLDIGDVNDKLFGNERRSFFFNEGELDVPVTSQLIQLFRSRFIPVKNMVAYTSNKLFLAAINYEEPVSAVDASVLKSLAMQSLFLSSLADRIRETENSFFYTIKTLAKAAELNDDDTGNHIVRVGQFSALLAERLGQPLQFVKNIAIQSRVHDVGKVKMPREILRKPGTLTEAEWELNRRHPLFGADIIGDHPRLKMAANIALTHHERWDGTGYPQGLKGDEIPLEGRIVCLADHYDALRNPRSCKRAYGHKEVCWIMTKGDHRTSPSHFDPKLLKIFRESQDVFNEMYQELGDDKQLNENDLRY